MTLTCEQPLPFELHVRLAKSQAIRREGVWQKRRIATRRSTSRWRRAHLCSNMSLLAA